MESVSFDTFAAGWNRIRANGAPNLKAVVAGFVDPNRIILQRIAETPEDLTIAFRGFDEALENPERDAPMLKKALLAWVKKFAPAQIMRGDLGVFMLQITKATAPVAQPQPTSPEPEPVRQGDLAQISNMRKVNGPT